MHVTPHTELCTTLRAISLASMSLIPPQNFGIVEVDLYRSGRPNELNFPFLEKLRLRKIIHLETDDGGGPELCAATALPIDSNLRCSPARTPPGRAA